MITNVNFNVLDETGVLSKVSIALLSNGFQIKGQSISPADEKNTSLIKIKLNAGEKIIEDDLKVLKELVPEIININCVNNTPVPTDKAKPITPISEDSDISKLTRSYFKTLVGAYPKITPVIKKINDEVDGTIRDEIFLKLGIALGKKQYNTVYSLGGLLDFEKTLMRMLKPCLKEFVEIHRFEPTTSDSAKLMLLNCPVCQDRVSDLPDCVFISGFIEGFLESVPNIKNAIVKQTQCNAMGNQYCNFEINGVST